MLFERKRRRKKLLHILLYLKTLARLRYEINRICLLLKLRQHRLRPNYVQQMSRFFLLSFLLCSLVGVFKDVRTTGVPKLRRIHPLESYLTLGKRFLVDRFWIFLVAFLLPACSILQLARSSILSLLSFTFAAVVSQLPFYLFFFTFPSLFSLSWKKARSFFLQNRRDLKLMPDKKSLVRVSLKRALKNIWGDVYIYIFSV